MRFLRTNTAVIVEVGPFLDKTDGVTPKTSLTITNERITLTASTDAGSAPSIVLDNVTGATSGTANDLNYITGQDNGMMQLELAAADVNRLGRMRLTITDAANHCPVVEDFIVLPARIYDSFVLGTVNAWLSPTTESRTLDVSAGGEAGLDLANVSALPAGAVPHLGIIDNGTAQAATSTTTTLRSAAAFGDNTLAGATLMAFGSTQGYWQSVQIASNVGSTDVATHDAWPVTPSGTITYIILGTPPSSVALPPTVKLSVGTGTGQVNVSGGKVPATIAAGDIATDALTGAAVKADAVTKIQAGLATATAVDDLPTNAELATALAGADDATLAAIAALFTTAMAESYAADGATMTPAQALYEIRGLLSEFAISGTTLTVKKKDGSTTAATYTLSDATNPTGITRAG